MAKKIQSVEKGTLMVWLSQREYGYVKPDKGGFDLRVYWDNAQGIVPGPQGPMFSGGKEFTVKGQTKTLTRQPRDYDRIVFSRTNEPIIWGFEAYWESCEREVKF